MAVVTRRGAHPLADANTARGAGETSLHNPLRSTLDWQSAIADTAEQAGEGIRGKIESALDGVVGDIYDETGIDLSGPAELLEQLLALPLDVLDATPLGQAVDVLGMFLPFLNGADPATFDTDDAATTFITDILDPVGLLPLLSGGLLDLSTIPGLDASMITSGEFPVEMIVGLAELLADMPGLSNLLDWFGLDPGGDENTVRDWSAGLLNGDSPVDALNLFNLGGRLGTLSIGNLSIEQTELLDNPDFREAISLQGGGIWVWDPSDGVDVPGCASVTANGSVRQLMSNAMAVAEGDDVAASVHAKWSGLTYTGTKPVRLQIVELLYNEITETFATMGTVDIAAPATPAADQSTWLALFGAYTVPANVSHIALQLYIGPNATGGTVKFDKGSAKKTGLLQIPWTEDLPDSLQDILDAGQETVDAIFEGITGFNRIGNLLSDVIAALQAFPFANVIGIGGPANIGDSVQETWDQWIGGLVGEVGTGTGLADLFNIGQQISSWASLGRQSWDILGIRNNKPMSTGMLPTSTTNISLDRIAFDTSARPDTGGGVAVTQTTARRIYKRVEDYSPIGVVSWTGANTTNLTDFNLNIFKLNQATGQEDLIYASPNIIGDVGAALSTNRHVLTTPIETVPGEVYVYEFAVRGTGTHRMAGSPSWYPPQNDMYPRRWAGVRNSGTSAPPISIPAANVTYADETPLVEVAITAGAVDIPHTPDIRLFQIVGSRLTPVPSWANFVDVIVLGGGGGGHQGGTWGIGGEGGEVGPWQWATWQRGVHFTGVASVNSTTGNGGSANSGNGGASSATLGGNTITGTGGPGANNFDVAGSEHSGDSPGNFTFPGGPPWTIVGGLEQNGYGAAGNGPGGGGGGGNWVSFQPGGRGAVGIVAIRFRQS